MERTKQIKLENTSLAHRVRNLVHARDGQTALRMLLSFMQLTVIRTPLDFFGMTTSRLEFGEVDCWVRPAAKYWFKVASISLAKIGGARK